MLMASISGVVEPSTNGFINSWGYGQNYRKLGDGATADRSSPAQVGLDNSWQHLAVGGYSVSAIKTDGTLWSWGTNGQGQLGAGTIATVYSLPVQIGALDTWASISQTHQHVIAIKNSGTLWAWGDNGSRQLGLGDTVDRSSPVQVGGGNSWRQASAGSGHTIAIQKDTNYLYAWGTNTYGCLGDGTTTLRATPVQVSTQQWFSVSASQFSNVAIRADGTLWSWGYNAYGQLGLGNTVSRSSPVQIGALNTWVIAITSGVSSYAIKNDGTLWAWGKNAGGELAQGDTTNRSSPVQIGSDTNWRWVATNSPYELGADGVVYAVKSDGTLWAWGAGTYGALGDGAVASRSSPVQIGSETDWTLSFSGGGVIATANGATGFGLRNPDGEPPSLPDPSSVIPQPPPTPPPPPPGRDSNAYGAGYNTNYILTDASSTTALPYMIDTENDWSKISIRGATCVTAIASDGTLWSWGANTNGALGYPGGDQSTPQQIGALNGWTDVSAGLAIRAGALWAWGDNTYGQLGDGSTTHQNSPIQVGAATDWAWVRSNGESCFGFRTGVGLFAWGYNGSGVLGLGNTANQSSPVQIGALTTWTDLAIMGASSPTQPTVTAIRSDGRIFGWGYNFQGRVGDGSTTNRSSPVQIGSDTDWWKVTAGGALKTDGTVWSWGSFVGDDTAVPKSSPVLIGGGGKFFAKSEQFMVGVAGTYNFLYVAGDFTGVLIPAPILVSGQISGGIQNCFIGPGAYFVLL